MFNKQIKSFMFNKFQGSILMKKIVIAIICILGVASFAFLTTDLQAQKIKGSDTMLPLSQKAAESFMSKNPSKTVSVTGGGSGVGIAALVEGSTDIAMSSRKIRFNEKKRLQESGKSVKEVIAAYDALAVIVHSGNKVSNLTREQLEGIFTGRIKNWREVGGDDINIVAYSRETSSGTYEFFKESVLQNKNYMSGILSMPATGGIIQSVSQTAGAIGYVGLAYVNDRVKAIKVSYDGKNYVEPNVANAKNKTYPIVRPLYYYHTTASASKVKGYIDFMLSAEGQKLVSDLGYVTLR